MSFFRSLINTVKEITMDEWLEEPEEKEEDFTKTEEFRLGKFDWFEDEYKSGERR